MSYCSYVYLQNLHFCVFFYLGIVYLDENLLPDLSALYLGIFYALSIVGPAFGYILGGMFLGIYTDADRVDEKE